MARYTLRQPAACHDRLSIAAGIAPNARLIPYGPAGQRSAGGVSTSGIGEKDFAGLESCRDSIESVEWRCLRHFAFVAPEWESRCTRAAETRRHTAQPSLSRRIHDPEPGGRPAAH